MSTSEESRSPLVAPPRAGLASSCPKAFESLPLRAVCSHCVCEQALELARECASPEPAVIPLTPRAGRGAGIARPPGRGCRPGPPWQVTPAGPGRCRILHFPTLLVSRA